MDEGLWGLQMRRFVASVAGVCSFALVGSGLAVVPAAADEQPATDASAEVVTSRADSVSAQVSARATGVRVEDLSQRTEREQVFANPDGSWTSESSTAVRFAEQDGAMVPIADLGSLESAGETITGAGTKLSIADGADKPGTGPTDTSVPLATLEGTGEDKGKKLELGWEGKLPAPEVKDNVATYDAGVTAPVENPTEPATETAPVKEESTPSDTAAKAAEAPAADVVDASVTVEPTRTGFSHLTVINEVPDGDVVLRFPLKLSKGLKAVLDERTGDLRAVDAAGETVFFAPAPTMWDAKVDEASGLNAAETRVQTSLETVDGVQVMVLKASKDWLGASERQYPVTIDPTWTSGVSDTWVQTGETGSKAGSTELRVGTFDSGKTKARSFLQFSSSALTGKKITKAELRLGNYYSYSCTSSPVLIKRVTSAWNSSDVRWTAQPGTTATGQGENNVSKGYSSSCAGGLVYYPMTAIAQHWADNPAQNFGVALFGKDETNNYTWKRYHSANWVEGAQDTYEPTFIVTYNSYPYTPSNPYFSTGEYTKDATGKIWARTLKPTFNVNVSDPDGGNVKAEIDMTGTPSLSKAAGTTVASKGVSVYKPTLTEGNTYTVKAWANDGSLRSKAAGESRTFTVDTKAPADPTFSNTGGYTNGGWLPVKPASNKFTFKSSSADVYEFRYWSPAFGLKFGTATNGSFTFDWNPSGANILRVSAMDRAGNRSKELEFNFGNGPASLSSPVAGQTSSDSFKVKASGAVSSTGTVTPKVYWRTADSVTADKAVYGSTDGWYEAATLPAIAKGAAVNVDTMVDIAAAPAGKLKELGKDRLATLVELQVCFEYEGAAASNKLQCTTNSQRKAVQVTKLPHAFGDNYPTAEAGDGQVALTTGELNLSETDVSVDAGNTGLSVSRTYSSYSGIGANSKIFGKGWRANIDGPDEGLAGLLVAESTGLDGTITLINDDESAAIFRQPGNGKVAFKTGIYAAANEDASASGWKVELTGSDAAARIKVTEEDGTVTSFIKGKNLEGNAKVFEWIPEQVTGGNGAGTSKFVADAAGRTTKVIAGTEIDLACDGDTPVKGCRVMNLAYDTTGKVTKVTYTAWDPIADKLATVPIAEYDYDDAGKTLSADARLVSVKDSRTGDTTTYSYGADSAAGVPLLASTEEKTSAGARVDAPTYYEYGQGNNTTGRSDWLEVVKRGNPTNGDDKLQLARFVYGVTPVGNGTDLPNLSAETVRLWEQGDQNRPMTGFAVFGPGKDINTSKASGVAAGDWKYADLQYVDGINRVVNTSSYAAGAWQSTATVLNQDNNVERSYDARAIRTILEDAKDTTKVSEGVLNAHTDYAALNYYIDDLSAYVDDDGNGLVPATGTDEEKAAAKVKNEATAEFLRGYVTDTFSPVTTDESSVPSRIHAKNTYTPLTDVDAGGMPRMLVTKATTTKANSGDISLSTGGEPVISAVEYGYDAFEKDKDGRAVTDKANLRSGWVVGSPTSVKTLMAGTGDDITVAARFDDQGRVVENRQPGSAGGDAGATKSVYYTAGPNADAACGNNPVYAGYLCKNTPQGAGSVAKHQTGFNIYGQPAEYTETSTNGDGAKRTTKQTYRDDGQELRTTVTTSGLTGSTPVQAVEKVYDSTGIQIGAKTVTDGSGAATEVKWAEDLWGRTTSYTNSLGETSMTEYDGFGNISKTVTPKTTTTYKYGALSGDGNTEYQGVVTSMTISDHGAAGQTGTYTATYDGDGNLLTQGIPGGFTQVQDYDASGKPTTLSYTGPIKDAEGNTSSGTWISWQTVRDVTGRIVGENTPDGDVLTGAGTEGDRGAEYDRAFEYDRAGRLIKVTDTTAPVGESINTDPEEGAVTPVSVRKYTFDKNGNRTSLKTSVDGTETSSRTWAYDAADRVGVGAGYAYDGLGRQTTIPAADAPRTNEKAAGAGDITIGYYDDDAARSITRDGVSTTIERDTAGRRLNLTTGTSKEVKHYTDDSDNPSWTTRTENGANEVLTRYESTIGGDLALTITDNVVELAVNNPHGDTVTTIPLTGDEAGKGIKGWAQYDEYGNQLTDTVDTGATTYGWHGADQRALDTSGLILMGARLYNSVTGLFTSRDPVSGGNSTTYTYPQNPVGMEDVLGLFGWGDALAWASAVTSFVPIPAVKVVSVGLSLASSGAYYLEGNKKAATAQLAGTVAGAFMPKWTTLSKYAKPVTGKQKAFFNSMDGGRATGYGTAVGNGATEKFYKEKKSYKKHSAKKKQGKKKPKSPPKYKKKMKPKSKSQKPKPRAAAHRGSFGGRAYKMAV